MLQSPTKLKGLLTGALALGAVVATTHAASAQTFAQFFQTNTGAAPFTFTNNGSSATFTATTQVLFNSNATGPTLANLFLTSNAVGNAFQGATGLQQNLTNVSLRIVGTDGVTNLLTATGTGSLQGDASTGLTSASFQASQNGVPADIVNFTSAVIPSLAVSTNRNYSISLSSVSMFSASPNSFLNSFTSSGTGTFAATIVPEPGTVAGLVALGGSMCGLIVRARRRTVKANA